MNEADHCAIGMRGIVPSLNTHLDRSGKIDDEALGAFVDETMSAGSQGVLAIAIAGEAGKPQLRREGPDREHPRSRS
jgi:hypothetical protein